MLKENYFLLSSKDYESLHDDFNIYLPNIRKFNDLNQLIDKINLDKGSILFIFFIEYPFLKSFKKYLNDNLNQNEHIIISFSDKNISSIASLENLFDYIDTSIHYNFGFLINRLNNEIENKNRINHLQSEVMEFYEIGKALSSEKNTLKLFEMIINSSINLTCSDAATMYLIIDKATERWSSISNNLIDNKLLKFVIAKNRSMEIDLQEVITPISKESIFGYSIISGNSLRINDAYSISPTMEYQHNKSYDLEAGYRTKSILSIPMKNNDGKILGVIQLINKKRNKNEIIDYKNEQSVSNIIPYDYSDEMIMNSLASQAAVALENNLLYEDLQQLLQSYKKQNTHLKILSKKILKAHEDERKRIAREIHDGPAQSTANLSLKTDISKKYLQKNDISNAINELDSLKKDIQATVKEIRTIIYDLKPSYLESGLFSAIENRVEIFSESTGIKTSFNVVGDDSKIEYYLTSTIYRIVQEVLSNIYKHAEATKVLITFEITNDAISFSISDNGQGFNINDPAIQERNKLEGGFGLEGIKERITIVNGKITISSNIGEGTSITIKIPLT